MSFESEAVERFGVAMLEVLSEPRNMLKKRWDVCSQAYLIRRLQEEVAEVVQSLHPSGGVSERELVDVANIAMMLWDNAKRTK